MSGLSNLSVGASPYPGLRPFRSDEADIFFGREEHVDHLLEKLGQNRFLAVMGPSGVSKRLTRSSTRSTGAAAGVTEAGLSCSWLVVADAGIRAPCTAINRRIV